MKRLLGALFLAGFLGCGKGGGNNLGSAQGAASFAPANPLIFAGLPVGDQAGLAVTLTNSGDGPLTVQSAAIAGANGSDFSFSLAGNPPLPLTLQSGEAIGLTVGFSPSASGLRSASLTLTDVAPSPNGTLALQGTGIASNDIGLTVSPTGCLAFGSVGLAATATLPLQLGNPNAYWIEPKVGPLSGPQATQFGFAVAGLATDAGVPPLDAGTANDGGADGGSMRLVLDGGASELVWISFTPSGVGSASASLAVAACQNCPTQQVCLTGSGLDGQLTLSPNPINFGLVLNAPRPLPGIVVTAAIAGDTPVQVNSIGPSSPNSVFSVDASALHLPATFQPDSGFSFTVHYSPSGVPGGDRDTLEVAAVILPNGPNQAARTVTAPLLGNTALAAGCQLVLEPDAGLDFGVIAAGSSFTRTAALVNQGAGPCTVTNLALATNSDPAFTLGSYPVPPDAGGSIPIAAHGQLQLPITFTAPKVPDHTQASGALTFSSSDPALSNGQLALRAAIQSLTANSGWPKWHHDAANTGQSEASTAQVKGQVLWAYTLPATYNVDFGSQTYRPRPGGYPSGPTIGADGTVYQMAFDGTFTALNPMSGTVAWAYPLAPPLSFPLPEATLAADGSIFMVDGDITAGDNFSLHQFSPSAHLPVFESAVLFSSTPAIGPAGQIYLYEPPNCGADGKLAYFSQDVLEPAVDVPTKVKLDCYQGGTTTPAIDNAGNTFWCMSGQCFKTNAQATVLWDEAVGVPNPGLAGAPVLFGSSLFYLSFGVQTDYPLGEAPVQRYHETLFQLDATAATAPTPKVVFDQAPVDFNSPLVLSSLYYSDNGNAKLTYTPSLAADGAAVLPFVDGVYCIETEGPNSGKLRWKVPVPGGALGNASLSEDGLAYVGTAEQGLLAIDLATGVVLWEFDLPETSTAGGGFVDSVSSEPALSDGVLYVTGDDGVVYALH